MAPSDEATAETRWLGYARRQWLLASVVSAGVIAGGSISTFLETPRESFHWASEGFFGRDTYAGGADKASHFVDYAIVTKELANLYGVMGFSRRDSILMSAAVTTLTGLVFEIGDGTNVYGFAWQDLTMDVLGVGAAALISALELDDLLGFRHGFLLPPPSTTSAARSRAQGAITRTRSTRQICTLRGSPAGSASTWARCAICSSRSRMAARAIRMGFRRCASARSDSKSASTSR